MPAKRSTTPRVTYKRKPAPTYKKRSNSYQKYGKTYRQKRYSKPMSLYRKLHAMTDAALSPVDQAQYMDFVLVSKNDMKTRSAMISTAPYYAVAAVAWM